MNAIRTWRMRVGGVGLALVVIALGAGCSSKVGPETREQAVRPVPSSAVVQVVQSAVSASRIPVVGTVVSEETVSLSARIPATVNQSLASAGDKVAKGQTLIVLDDRDIKAQLAAADAQFKQAEAEYRRTLKLMDAKATTAQALEAAEAAFNAARAQMERAKVMMTYAIIVSPIDGIVTERRIEVGDMAAPGQVLLSVYDSKRMRLECPVPTRLVDTLPLGKEIEVVLDRPAKTFKGRVTEIVSEVDATTRTQKVKVRLDGATGDVLPGTFGRLWIEDQATETVRVPVTAVYRIGQLEMVQVVDGKGVVRRAVKTGAVSGDTVEILSGLSSGEKIIVNPAKEG